MWELIDLWGFLAGLGLFLLGMFLLEQGLRGLASRSLKRFLREQTRSPLRGVVTGTVATTLLQSSSLVGLIVLAFVGAGILELRNALGVIFGANLGTTFKGWIVTFIGFTVDFGDFAEPMIALGSMGTVFLPKERRPFFYSNLILGLGLLLLGLDEMKGGFERLAENVDVSVFRGYHAVTYLAAGAFFTAIIQSSSATMMILLSALHAQVIDLPSAAALAIGADLGTTSTVMLGALKGTADKRRVALSHFLFNLVTDVVAFLLLPVLLTFITTVVSVRDPLYALVMFHSLFNVIGIMIFLPMVNPFLGMLRKLVRERQGRTACAFIGRVPAKVTDAAIEAARKELLGLLVRCIRLNLAAFGVRAERVLGDRAVPPGTPPDRETATGGDAYLRIKQAAGELQAYTYDVQSAGIDPADAREITQVNHAVRNVGYAAKYVKDILHNLNEFSDADKDVIRERYRDFREQLVTLYTRIAQLLEQDTPELGAHHFLEIRRELRRGYERSIDNIYLSVGSDILSSTETASLLNANRALYLSAMALLEAIRVLRRLDETSIMQTPEALLTLEAHDIH